MTIAVKRDQREYDKFSDVTNLPAIRVDVVQGVSMPLPTGAATEATLASIKDTAGIKKITDALPAGTNLLGSMAAVDSTGTVYQGTTAKTPVSAFANVSASGTDTNLVSALGASTKIRVLAIAMVAGATATNITFNTKPAGAGSAISCLFACPANGGAVLGYNSQGWFTTSANEGLTATTGAGSTVGVHLVYIPVT
jgi:hypothetical protein